MVKHSIREELYGVVAFVGVAWGVFLVGSVLPFDFNALGVTPRTLVGLVGIPVMPFLHASLAHLLSNTFPLLVLLALLAGSRANSWAIVAAIVALSGLLLWLLGRPAVHIGASALIYGLIAFLLVSGFLERRLVPLIISLVVGFLYGGVLLTGIVPRPGSQVSWEGHLFGAVAGAAVAWLMLRSAEPSPRLNGPAR